MVHNSHEVWILTAVCEGWEIMKFHVFVSNSASVGQVTLVAITGPNILVHYLYVNSHNNISCSS